MDKRIWVTSDLHLGHKRAALEFRKERNYSSVEEHDQDIVNIWNNTVSKEDTVYHLGDFCWKSNHIQRFIEKLNGSIVFINGNHDDKKDYEKIGIKTYSIFEMDYEQTIITLCHYPMLSWNCSHFGSISVHGHHHSDISKVFPGKRVNVCWEVAGYKLLSIEEVVEKAKELPDNWDLIKQG